MTGAFRELGLIIPESARVINSIFAPYRMPFLMVLSGLLFYKSLNKGDFKNIRGKLEMIIWPFLIWTAAFFAAKGTLDFATFPEQSVSGSAPMWYLWYLAAYYILTTLVERVKFPILLLMVIMVLLKPVVPDTIGRFVYLFFFFLLGHLVASKGLLPRISRPMAFCGLALALAGAVISMAFFSIRYNMLYVWAPLGLTAGLLYLSQFYRTHAWTQPMEWIGRNSIVFYVVHLPLQIVLAKQLFQGTTLSPVLLYWLIFALSVACCAMAQGLRSRFEASSFLFDFGVLRRSFSRQLANS